MDDTLQSTPSPTLPAPTSKYFSVERTTLSHYHLEIFPLINRFMTISDDRLLLAYDLLC